MKEKTKTTNNKPAKGKKSAKDKLNLEQQKFCELFATDQEFFGNGVRAYVEAYSINLSKSGAYQSAKTCAWRLLTNVDISAYITELLESVLNETHADTQLAFLIAQNADFGAKLGAIREFNALRQRIVKKVEAKIEVKSLAQMIHQSLKDDPQDYSKDSNEE